MCFTLIKLYHLKAAANFTTVTAHIVVLPDLAMAGMMSMFLSEPQLDVSTMLIAQETSLVFENLAAASVDKDGVACLAAVGGALYDDERDIVTAASGPAKNATGFDLLEEEKVAAQREGESMTPRLTPRVYHTPRFIMVAGASETSL